MTYIEALKFSTRLGAKVKRETIGDNKYLLVSIKLSPEKWLHYRAAIRDDYPGDKEKAAFTEACCMLDREISHEM